MNALLLQLDGKLPNIALMRLSAYLTQRGHSVTFRRVTGPAGVERCLSDEHDQVYASLIFERTRPLAERLLHVHPTAILGGTGWDLTTTLESIGVTTLEQDYSLYPDFPHSIGFTQRGCRLRCKFCVVPKKEGSIRGERTIADLWRGDPHPRNLLLLDNDFFGQGDWRERMREIRNGGFKVCFSQGINVRDLDEEAAEAIASVRYRDDSFTRPRIYTAWDNQKDEARLFVGLARLVAAGVKPDQIMVYMLVGYWPGETHEIRDYRRHRLREFGARPYPMPYVRTPQLVAYQRWVVGAYDKRIPWGEWWAANGRPEKLRQPDSSLPLLQCL